jgi:hypothetical protein
LGAIFLLKQQKEKMTKEHQRRLSLIDGALEEIQPGEVPKLQKKLVPVFEEFIVQVLTLEGLEDKVLKRIVEYRESEA